MNMAKLLSALGDDCVINGELDGQVLLHQLHRLGYDITPTAFTAEQIPAPDPNAFLL